MVWACTTHFNFPRKTLRVLCGYFEHQRRVQCEGCVAEPLQTTTPTLPRSKWTENGKEDKSKLIASCRYLEEKLRDCGKRGGVIMAESVETLGVDLRKRTNLLGAKEKARRNKCNVRSY